MISSMTGFGQACAEVDGVVYTVEVRSVNNRYFKSQLRMPDMVAFLEGEIEKNVPELLAERFQLAGIGSGQIQQLPSPDLVQKLFLRLVDPVQVGAGQKEAQVLIRFG